MAVVVHVDSEMVIGSQFPYNHLPESKKTFSCSGLRLAKRSGTYNLTDTDALRDAVWGGRNFLLFSVSTYQELLRGVSVEDQVCKSAQTLKTDPILSPD
jgi:hypothetical protein